VTEFNLGNDTFPSGIFLQGDSIWITETLNHNKLVQFKPITSANGTVIGVTKLSEIPPSSASEPVYLFQPSSAGSNGNKDAVHFITPTDLAVFEGKNGKTSSIWLPEHGTSFITEYETASKSVMRFPTSASYRHYVTLPYWMAEAPDGKGFWFNEHEGNRISFFNITDMTLTEYEIPTRDPVDGYLANALTIAVDPNDTNKVWFTEFNHDKIGVVNDSVPIQFSVHPKSDRAAVLSNNRTLKKASINLEITTTKYENNGYHRSSNNNTNNDHAIVFLNASSSMNPGGRFVNITASFSPSPIVNISNATQAGQANLIIHRNKDTSVPGGNYTVGISATDGTVSKSSFRDLLVGK